MVELAGGIWSPIAHDGDCLDLTRVLAPDAIVLVADAGLGTINAIRPAVAALTSIAPVVTLLNRFDEGDELHRRNRDWLADRDGFEVVTSVDALADRLAG
jgi:dethiobiotin synthetase